MNTGGYGWIWIQIWIWIRLMYTNKNWLVVWNHGSLLFHILGISSSQLTNSYFSEGFKPPTRFQWVYDVPWEGIRCKSDLGRHGWWCPYSWMDRMVSLTNSRTGPHWLAIRRMDKVPTDGVNGQLLTMPCQVALDAQRERSRCGTLEHWSMLDGLSHADPKMVRWWNWDFMQICRFKAPNAIAQVMSVRRYEQAFERQEDKWPVGLPGRHQRNVGDQLVQAFPGRIGMSQTIFSSTHLRMTWHQLRRRGFKNW